jgi:hypothetical protein
MRTIGFSCTDRCTQDAFIFPRSCRRPSGVAAGFKSAPKLGAAPERLRPAVVLAPPPRGTNTGSARCVRIITFDRARYLLSVGRDDKCDVCVGWDEQVSRLHARLERSGGS